MQQKHTVEIEFSHIQEGVPNDSKRCAMAIAIDQYFDEIDDPRSVILDGRGTEINCEDYTQDEEVTEWVRNFDTHEDEELIIHPCTIEIDDEEQHISMINFTDAEEYPEWDVSFPVYHHSTAHVRVRARNESEALEKAAEAEELDFGDVNDTEIAYEAGWAEEY